MRYFAQECNSRTAITGTNDGQLLGCHVALLDHNEFIRFVIWRCSNMSNLFLFDILCAIRLMRQRLFRKYLDKPLPELAHHSDFTSTSWRLKSPQPALFDQQLVQDNNKEITKAPRHCPFMWNPSVSDWFPSKECGKCAHDMKDEDDEDCQEEVVGMMVTFKMTMTNICFIVGF